MSNQKQIWISEIDGRYGDVHVGQCRTCRRDVFARAHMSADEWEFECVPCVIADEERAWNEGYRPTPTQEQVRFMRHRERMLRLQRLRKPARSAFLEGR